MLGAGPNHKTLNYGFAIQFNIHQFTPPHIHTRLTRIAAPQHHTWTIPHKETTQNRIHKDTLTATSQPSIYQPNRKICSLVPNTQHPTQPQLRASKDNVASNAQTINNAQATIWNACRNTDRREPSTPHHIHTMPVTHTTTVARNHPQTQQQFHTPTPLNKPNAQPNRKRPHTQNLETRPLNNLKQARNTTCP